MQKKKMFAEKVNHSIIVSHDAYKVHGNASKEFECKSPGSHHTETIPVSEVIHFVFETVMRLHETFQLNVLFHGPSQSHNCIFFLFSFPLNPNPGTTKKKKTHPKSSSRFEMGVAVSVYQVVIVSHQCYQRIWMHRSIYRMRTIRMP